MILGIDPGLNGGLCWNKHGSLHMMPMPRIDKFLDLRSIVEAMISKAEGLEHVYLELVGAMPKQGVSSMFKFGRVFGNIEGMLATLGVPYTLVTPQRWMKQMHQGMNKKMKPKDRSALSVRRIFPSYSFLKSERSRVMHDGMVDAALISEYGRRLHALISTPDEDQEGNQESDIAGEPFRHAAHTKPAGH